MDIRECINEADMILIGLGEEFDMTKELRSNKAYQDAEMLLKENDMQWMIPRLQRKFRDNILHEVLLKCKEAFAEKYYYVISTSVAGEIEEIAWKRDSFVMPLGSGSLLQCSYECEQGPVSLSNDDELKIEAFMDGLLQNKKIGTLDFGVCPKCGKKRIMHSIYAGELFDERGAKDAWERYTKWLQGSLNRKILLLELGVGMQFPTVIRMPFEKIAALNTKAKLIRVNETLPFLPEELGEKGFAIKENAIAWLNSMC